jgi:hypothetical protein
MIVNVPLDSASTKTFSAISFVHPAYHHPLPLGRRMTTIPVGGGGDDAHRTGTGNPAVVVVAPVDTRRGTDSRPDDVVVAVEVHPNTVATANRGIHRRNNRRVVVVVVETTMTTADTYHHRPPRNQSSRMNCVLPRAPAIVPTIRTGCRNRNNFGAAWH